MPRFRAWSLYNKACAAVDAVGLSPVVAGSHVRAEVRAQALKRFADVERLEAGDIADAITYIVTRPRRVAVNEVLIRPTEQEG